MRHTSVTHIPLRLVALAVLSASGVLCHAGTWAYQFTGGSSSSGKSPTISGGSWGISANVPNNDPLVLDIHGPAVESDLFWAQSGSSSVTGPTNVTCTYTPAPGDPPIADVVLQVQVNSSYTGIATGSVCNDGYPSDPFTPPNGQPNGIGQNQMGAHVLGLFTPQGNVVTATFNSSNATGVNNPNSQIKNLSTASAGVTVTAFVITDTVSISPRIQAMSWDSTNHIQTANYACTDNVGVPTGWSLSGCTWSSDAGSNFVIDSPNNFSTNAHYHIVGVVNVTATAQIITNIGVTMNIPANKHCASFGGPVKFTTSPGSVPTWNNDANDATLPYYLESFYTHDTVVTGGMQSQQTGQVEMDNQPAGSSYNWTLPSFLYPLASLTGSLVPVTADSPGLGAVSCQISEHWQDPDDPTGQTYINANGADDTASTQMQSNGQWVPEPNQFDAHQPGALSWTVSGTQNYTPSGVPSGGCGAETDYSLTVSDTGGGPMPGVWVNERFTQPLPPNFIINGPGRWWTSTPPTGILNDLDYISYIWAAPPPPWQTYTTVHEYWAATSSPTIGDPGFKVATATITLVPSASNPSATQN